MVVRERPFTSHLPIIGKVVARLRTIWSNITLRHYVQALQQQQNEFNQLLTAYFKQHQTKLMDQDTNKIEMIHAFATLQTQIAQINEQLQAIEARLNRLNKQ